MPAEYDDYACEMQRIADEIALMRLTMLKVRADMEANKKLLAKLRWPLTHIKQPEKGRDGS